LTFVPLENGTDISISRTCSLRKKNEKRNEIVIHAVQAKDTNPFRIIPETLMKK